MASTPDRGTKINMDLVPTIQSDFDQQTQLLHPSTLTNNTTHSLAKRKAPLETYRVLKHPKEITSTNQPLLAKSAYHNQVLVLAGKAASSGTDAVQESPWVRYRRVYELNFSGPVSVVSERVAPHNLFIVKKLEGRTAGQRVRMLQAVRHRSFHYMLKCFSFQDSYFAVFDHESVSLAHIAKSPPYLTELELAAIVGQILEGLAYLASEGLEHGSLTCANILLGAGGDIKITDHECCKESASSTQDIKALGYITMELMQKYANENGAIGLEDFDRWPSDGNAVDFLAMTTSATSVDQLLQHPLLQCHWIKEDLKWIIALAAVSTSRGFHYKVLS